MLKKIDTQELLKSFRLANHQSEEKYVPQKHSKLKSGKNNHKNVTSDRFQSFLNKYGDLENTIETFNAQDLMYFFREKARESGVKYVIANMKRDLGIFKRLQQDYDNYEICLMVEFLFFSNQNYLDITSLQPTVLTSTWCNTIYHDAMLWVDDKYDPYTSKKINSEKSKREWGHKVDSSRSKTKIGEWS